MTFTFNADYDKKTGTFTINFLDYTSSDLVLKTKTVDREVKQSMIDLLQKNLDKLLPDDRPFVESMRVSNCVISLKQLYERVE